MTARRGIALNTVLAGANTLIRLLVGFALLPLLKDGIGDDRAGLFLFATTLTGYFVAFDNSVMQSVTRFVAEHRAREEEDELAATIRASVGVLVGFGALAAGVLVIVALLAARSLFDESSLRSVAEPTILITALTSALYWPTRVGVAALGGLERYDASALIQIVTSLLLLAGIGGLAHAHASVVVLVAVYGAIVTLEGLIAIAIVWRPLGIGRSWWRGRWFGGEKLRAVLSFGAAAFAIGLSDTLVNAFDSAIVGALVSAAGILLYNAAARPQTGVRQVGALSGLALVSPVARLHATGQQRRLKELLLVASFVSVAVTAPVAVLVVVLAKPFFVAWLGAGYGAHAFYLQLFTVGWVLTAAFAALSAALYGIGRLAFYARLQLAMGLVSLPLSVGLTLAWGTVGVIWGTVIPGFVQMPIFVRHALRELGLGWREFSRAVLLPGYGVIGAWTAVVIAAKLLVDPRGYAGLAAFGALALAAVWGALAPMLRDRVRTARALAADGD